MTSYAASGPGVQMVDDSPALSLPFERTSVATCIVRPENDQLSGPEEICEGIRVTWATNPRSLQRVPARVQFDADKLTPEDCKAWLSSHNVSSYEFLPADDGKAPQYCGGEAHPDEQPPAGEGFASLSDFYARTEGTRSGAISQADVQRAGESLLHCFQLDSACDAIRRGM